MKDLSSLSREERLKKAKLRLLNLLQRRAYTEYELRNKLDTSGFEQDVIDEAMTYVAELGLTDDLKYCRDFIAYGSARKSRKRLAADLRQKGVPKDVIDEAMQAVIKDGDMADEEELIRKLMDKRHYDRDEATFEETQKMKAYLYGKGFDPDAIGRCL